MITRAVLNHVRAVAVLTSILMLPGCGRAPVTSEYPTSFRDKGASAQNRLGDYFQKSVITSKLRDRWGQLQGQGAIAMDFAYRKSGDTWAFEKVAVTKSTLAKEQEAVAERSMEESARSTSFPLEPGEPLEKVAEKFVVRMTVPIPLPPEGAQLTSEQIALIKGGSGGGLGDVAGCSECVSRTEYPYGLKCESRTSGGHLDCREESTNVCSTAPTTCFQGIFSGSNGVIMY
jgi:hypothetical protein